MAVKLVKTSFVFLFVVILFAGCSGNEAKDSSAKPYSLSFDYNRYSTNIDKLDGEVNKVKFGYDNSGIPYVLVLENDTVLTLYYWNNGWNKKILRDDRTIRSFDFLLIAKNIKVYYTYISGTDSHLGKIDYNVSNDKILLQDLTFASNPLFPVVIDYSDIVSLFFIDNNSMQLFDASNVENDWYVENINDGVSNDLEGTFYYEPSVTYEADNINVLYYDTSGPSLRLTTKGVNGWTSNKVPLASDIVPAPNFDIKINSWGGTDIVFQESSNGYIYYAGYATGWTIEPIVKNGHYTGFSPKIFYVNNKLAVFYYDMTYNDIRFSIKTHPFFDQLGELTSSWKENILPFGSGININYDINSIPGKDDLFGIVYIDKSNNLNFKEFSFNGVNR